MTKKILNHSQAEAVYSAMCALNNVGARIAANMPTRDGESVNVFERENGTVSIWLQNHGVTHSDETHTTQAAFAIAYGLLQG